MPAQIGKHLLSNNWTIHTAQHLEVGGEQIARKDFDDKDWIRAQVPGTVLGSLVQSGLYPDPYFGTNLRDIPTAQFEHAWWYRREWVMPENFLDQTVLLCLDGINYYANIWINGKLVAQTEGAYRRYRFNISSSLRAGNNVFAIEVFPPKAGDYSVGFVDWNPEPPDRNMGLFRNVYLAVNGGVAIENPVVTTTLPDGEPLQAALHPKTELVNYTAQVMRGELIGSVADRTFTKAVTLQAGERKTVRFGIEDFSQLLLKAPKLWWPNHFGEPHLYQLKFTFRVVGQDLDTCMFSFGIREIEDYWTPAGHRGFKINGKSVLIKGAGWTDDLLLQNTHEDLEAQIAYVKHLNLNCIRLEGFWGKDEYLYDLCDRHGILVMVGWSCHWEHEQYLGKPVHEQYGGVVEEADQDFIAQCWKDQLLWLRHHASIFVWTVASDFIPHPDLERKYIDLFNQYDPTRPYLNSTGGVGSEQAIVTNSAIISEISGSSGMKMLGPYAYTPPIYWYTNEDRGGAYGFNTETCPGANVPPMESIRKMIPVDHHWPVDEVWHFHCGRNAFGTLERIENAIAARYGAADDVADFTRKAQWLNYELMRPMFEAFRVNHGISTGIIQWMLNSAFPSMYWQLYDSYLQPNGAFYATRKACEPLHLLYHYGERAIYLINEQGRPLHQYSARIRVYDIHSNLLFNRTVVLPETRSSVVSFLQLPAIEGLSTTWFLDLRLYDESLEEVGNNFYWLSTQEDVLDEEAELDDWDFYTPTKVYADLKGLATMPQPRLRVDHKFRNNGTGCSVDVTLENPTDQIAFFVELRIVDKATGCNILPVFWEDNYVSLLPGESRDICGKFTSSQREVDLLLA